MKSVNKKNANKLNHEVRKLGAIESRMALFHANLSGSTQGTQIIDFQTKVSNAILKKAIHYLYQEYISLQCSIKNKPNELWFYQDVNFSDIDIKIIHLNKGHEKQSIISNSVDQPLEQEKSLWKITIIREDDSEDNTLVFTAHHSIIDANGMHALANSLFKIINSLLSKEEYSISETKPLPKPVDDFLNASTPSPNSSNIFDNRQHDVQCPISYRKTGWKNLIIEGNMLKNFNLALAKDKLKLHSVVTSAFCLAINDIDFMKPPFSFGTAVSLRFLQDKNNNNALGCYMSIAEKTIDSS